MATFNTEVQLTNTGNSKKKNSSTSVITGTNTYGDYFGSGVQSQNAFFTKEMIQQRFAEDEEKWQNLPYITRDKGVYGSVLNPNKPVVEPVYTPVIGGGNSLVGGGSAIGGNLVKPVDPSQYFDGGVVGTVGGGFSGGNKGDATDEGVIVGGLPNADDATFDNNGFKGTAPTFVPPASGGSGSVSNGGTTTGTGAGAGTSTGDSTPTDTKTDTEETGTMTYEEWFETQKRIEEEKRQRALKDAEIYKERAAADAQASYMQNMSTYGVNAETMAQMGLTGGGYSDYLNAQAYAQKRGEIQTASANEAAMKQQAHSTYADGIAALNKDYFTYQETQKTNKQTGYNTLLGYAMDANSGLTEDTIRAMAKNIGLSEEEIQSIIGTMNTAQSTAKGEYANNALTALIADLQNPNAYGNYSEAGIRALGKQWGWTDEQIGQAVDIWNDTKKGAEVSLDGESEDDSASAFESTVSDIQSAIVQDGQVLFKNADGSYTAYTREQVYEMCLQDRNAGNLTDDEVKQIMTEYDRKLAYANGKISTDEYYNAANGDKTAGQIADNAVDSSKFETDSKSKAKGYMADINYPGAKLSDKVINTNRDLFKVSEFGSYNGTGNNKTQDNYLNQIVADAKAGKIKEGQCIIANYGVVEEENGYYLYVGEGVFVKIEDVGTNPQLKAIVKKLYLPDGYKVNGRHVRKK